MFWHAETTMRLELQLGPGQWLRLHKVTLRGYEEADGYERRLPFKAVAQADLMLEEGRAFVHAALADGRQLARRDWRALVRLLARDHAIKTISADRHGRARAYAAASIAPTTGASLQMFPDQSLSRPRDTKAG